MNEYQVKFKSSAAKEFRKLPSKIKERIREAINQLTKNPLPSGVVKLKGDDRLFRIRIGKYRIVYEIDDSIKLVRITRVRHRQLLEQAEDQSDLEVAESRMNDPKQETISFDDFFADLED
jgi:mRNA interferase RelE/StbE